MASVTPLNLQGEPCVLPTIHLCHPILLSYLPLKLPPDQADLPCHIQNGCEILNPGQQHFGRWLSRSSEGRSRQSDDHYLCPKSRKDPSNPTWNNIKKMQYHIRSDSTTRLQAQFCGDEERFFAFFTLASDELKQEKADKRPRGYAGYAEDCRINLTYGSWHQNREGTT